MPTPTEDPMHPAEVAQGPVLTPGGLQEPSTNAKEEKPSSSTELATRVPPSGFHMAIQETGRTIGWLTWPIWKPPTWLVTNLLAKDTLKILRAPLISREHLRAWLDRGRNDLRDWDAWAPAERASVRRQETMWMLCWIVSAFLALTAGSIRVGRLGLFPIGLVAGAWVLRSHNTRLPFRFDAVRWLLNLNQVDREARIHIDEATKVQNPD